MTSGAQLLRKPGQPRQVTFLELFFDLVFIFALTRVSQRLVEDITSERHIVLTEAAQTLLVLLAIWAVWTATTLITDLYDPDHPQIQFLVVATMFASLVMAIACLRRSASAAWCSPGHTWPSISVAACSWCPLFAVTRRNAEPPGCCSGSACPPSHGSPGRCSHRAWPVGRYGP
jgi:hypothetical protein